MKQVYRQETIESVRGFTLPINTGKQNQYSKYKEILIKADEQLAAMLSYHCKILVVRIDLHLNQFTSNNACVSEFIRAFRKKVTRRYKLKRLGYLWVREIEKSKKQHYHCAFILDANKVNHSDKIIEIAKELWTGKSMGHIPTIAKPYIVIDRKCNDAYRAVFWRLSYFAKTRGKGQGVRGYLRDEAANDYSASRIKIKAH